MEILVDRRILLNIFSCFHQSALGLKLSPEILSVVPGGFHLYSYPSLSMVFYLLFVYFDRKQ